MENTVEDYNVRFGGSNIKQVKTTKYLGVIIDEKLWWKQQVDSGSTKTSRAIDMIRRAKPYVNSDLLKLMYNSLVGQL